MLFFCALNGIKNRIVDVSHQAFYSKHFPVSVGLRSQTLKLKFVSPETEGRFLQPNGGHKKILEIIKQQFNRSIPKPIFFHTFIGETISQIYSPFYVDKKIYDAVLNRPVSSQLPDNFDILEFPEESPDWRIRFIPAQCPDCGWDLDGERDSLILHCRNCNSAWYPVKESFKKLKFSYIPEEGGNVTYLPFYRIKADISGLQLESYADLIKAANLPKVVREPWKERIFYFWLPAFKVRPHDFLNFMRNLTLSQPENKLKPEMPQGRLHPATLPIYEAIDGLKLTLASFIKPERIWFPKLMEAEIKAREFLLVYVPFNERGNELSCPSFSLRINKKLLAYGRNL